MARRNGRGISRVMGRGTPIFSFETPSRERTGHDINRSTRELLRDITGSNHGDSPGATTSVTLTSTPSCQSGSPSPKNETAPAPALQSNTVSENLTPSRMTNTSTPSSGTGTQLSVQTLSSVL